jgi:uncharacterized membrane protein
MGTQVDHATRTSNGNASALAASRRPASDVTAPFQRIADRDRGTGGESLADFLGSFSLGLGLAELLIPGGMARLSGVDSNERNRKLLRVMGLREFSNGVAVLSKQQPANAMWSRVVGDALDLACLGVALANSDNDRGRTLFATANVLAVTALDVMCARQLSMQPETPANAGADAGIIHTRRSITVNREPSEVYGFWRDFVNLPRFMRHLESVRVVDERRSHWVARAPAGRSVEWDADLTADTPNELIAWRSVEGSDIYNAGSVRFRPGPRGRGTEVRIDMEYDPPFGKLGSKIAMLFREEPGQQVQDDLRHFKQVMEAGEIVVSDATKHRGPHAGRPDGRGVSL